MKKINIINFLSAIILIAFISSCGKPSEQKSSSTKVQTEEAKMDSLVKLISGQYSGSLPCADCEGISYSLLLNSTMNFKSKSIYIGREVTPLESQGTWKMIDDSILILESTSDVPTYLKINNNLTLRMLDGDKNEIKGPLESNFILHKESTHRDTSIKSSSNIPKEKFVLQSLNDKKISEKDDMKEPPSLTIDSQNGTVSGSTGCNRLNGKVKINGNEISFSEFVMTRMMCPGTGEKDFLDALKNVKTFKIENEKLYLMNMDKIVVVFVKEE